MLLMKKINEMNKPLCFIIDEERVYLDKVLVCFNDIPVYFVCRDLKDNYYLALCSNLDKVEYIVVKQSVRVLWEMLTDKITMRLSLIKCKHFWFVKSGESTEKDIVRKLSVDRMNQEVLPAEGALYECITEDDHRYVERIASEYQDHIKKKA